MTFNTLHIVLGSGHQNERHMVFLFKKFSLLEVILLYTNPRVQT